MISTGSALLGFRGDAERIVCGRTYVHLADTSECQSDGRRRHLSLQARRRGAGKDGKPGALLCARAHEDLAERFVLLSFPFDRNIYRH